MTQQQTTTRPLDTEELVQKFREYNWAAEEMMSTADAEEQIEFRNKQNELAGALAEVAERLRASEDTLDKTDRSTFDARNSLDRTAWAMGQMYLAAVNV